MTAGEITEWMTSTLEFAQAVEVDGNIFFFEDEDHKMPFATLLTNDLHDRESMLEREGVFRLNVGVGKETFHKLCAKALAGTRKDFTKLDTWMPHPAYGQMQWICILNPSEGKGGQVREILTEAYEIARKRRERRVLY